jgi:hypothetical protein
VRRPVRALFDPEHHVVHQTAPGETVDAFSDDKFPQGFESDRAEKIDETRNDEAPSQPVIDSLGNPEQDQAGKHDGEKCGDVPEKSPSTPALNWNYRLVHGEAAYGR